MQRKIIPDAENRLLILYALKTVGAMTDQQLLIVMTFGRVRRRETLCDMQNQDA